MVFGKPNSESNLTQMEMLLRGLGKTTELYHVAVRVNFGRSEKIHASKRCKNGLAQFFGDFGLHTKPCFKRWNGLIEQHAQTV